MKQIIITSLLSLIILSSCTVSKEQVGNYNNTEGKTTLYKKDKDFYLFWNLIPVKNIEKNLTITDYEIIYRRSFFDAIIYGGTLGIFSYYNVKIFIKESDEEQNNNEELHE
jgi:hypothetical protein